MYLNGICAVCALETSRNGGRPEAKIKCAWRMGGNRWLNRGVPL